MTAQAEEVPFIAAMEREAALEVTIETGRKAFRLDGMLDRLLAKGREALEARQHDRGPDPDMDADDDDDIRRLAGIIERLAQRPPDNGYHEGPRSGSSLKTIIIGCSIGIITSVVGGAWALSMQMAAFHEWQVATEKRLDKLEALKP